MVYLNKKLFDAVESGNIKVVEKLIKKGADINLEYERTTLLKMALGNGYIEIAKLLIKNGAKDLNTNFLFSAYKGYDEIIQLLIEKGVDVNFKDYSGKTALDYAKERHRNNSELIQILTNAINKKQHKI